MSTQKEKKVFEKFFKLLGFEPERKSKHGEVWRHHAKKIVLPPVPNSPSDTNWTKGYRQNLTKILSPLFTKEEFTTLLEPLFKKRKVKYTDDGRIRLLRIKGDLETEIIKDLLIDEIELDDDDDFEFSDEMKSKIKKMKKL
jgi:hypothetical protein